MKYLVEFVIIFNFKSRLKLFKSNIMREKIVNYLVVQFNRIEIVFQVFFFNYRLFYLFLVLMVNGVGISLLYQFKYNLYFIENKNKGIKVIIFGKNNKCF